jgi:aryl-alcohol dehydrogenase-like predicted oxidoreductase
MAPKKRPLGKTGYSVSELGLGGWGLGGGQWLGASDAEGREALRAAIDQGITFFDTALAYGGGHSEKLIGDALKGELKSGRAVVATKIPPRNERWPASPQTSVKDVFPPGHITTSTERSLKHLGLDALPIQQFHVWHDAWLADPTWQASYAELVRLKREGKVLHWGISINDHAPETALKVLADPLFETAQVIYNIYDRSPEKALFDLARFREIGIIVRVPFDEGALTGGVKATTVFPAGDWREEYFKGDRRAEAERRGKALAEVLDEEVRTLPELALRFCLSSPAVSTVIPGMRRQAHVRQNVAAAARGALSAQMLSRLEGHRWEKNWYPE